jgi:hypothetical protein
MVNAGFVKVNKQKQRTSNCVSCILTILKVNPERNVSWFMSKTAEATGIFGSFALYVRDNVWAVSYVSTFLHVRANLPPVGVLNIWPVLYLLPSVCCNTVVI